MPAVKLELGYTKQEGGIPCPKCESASACKDTFWSSKFNGTGRRRQCRNCGWVFWTVETVVKEGQ